MMKKILLFCICILMLLGSGCGQENVSTEIGDNIFGTFTAVDMDGNMVDESVFSSHKLTMVNVWGTFCGPCVEEMPALSSLNQAFGKDFQVIGIPLDVTDKNGQILPGKKAEAQELIELTKANYQHILPDPTMRKAFLNDLQSVPCTVFINGKGQQIGQIYMGSKTEKQWHHIIESILESMK